MSALRAAVPRSGIEKQLKEALFKRRDQDTAIAWTPSHIGIPGDEKPDERAEFESLFGAIAGSPRTAMEEGLRSWPRARQREERQAKGFGVRRSDLGQTGGFRLHLAKDRMGTPEELATQARQGTRPVLPMRPSGSGRPTHNVQLPQIHKMSPEIGLGIQHSAIPR